MKNVTLKDVAKAAGVSYATVSRALSGSSQIGSETRERVLKLCDEMGYTTNFVARSMVTKRTNLIGLVVPSVDNQFMSELAYHAEVSARAHGYNIMLCDSGPDLKQEKTVFKLLLGRQVDGILIVPQSSRSYDNLKSYLDQVPTVFLSENLRSQPQSYVAVDNSLGTYLGTQYLYELGHRDILYFGQRRSTTHQLRAEGYMKACQELRKKICELGAQMIEVDQDKVDFDGSYVFCDGEEEEKRVSLEQIALKGTFFNNIELQVVKQHSSPLSPPPFMVGMAEVEVDTETGTVEVLDYVAAVDCGTPINPNLARVQTEGGIAQGIGMALFEEVQYTEKGKVRNNSLMQYKIPTREDFGNIRVAFESSYEESGPFGAKSIGELVIDTPCPAIAEAIYNATGVRVRELPITPEKIALGILKKKLEK